MKQSTIQLIEKYLDEELSEQELNELLQIIENDPEALTELNQALELKGLIHVSQHSQTGNLEKRVLAELANSDARALEDRVIEEIEVPQVRSFPAWLMAALAAQILLLPLLYFGVFQDNKTIKKSLIEIARVQEVKGYSFIVRGEEKVNLRPGDKLYSGDHFHVQEHSHLNLAYADGSILKFLGNSFVRLSELRGQKKVELFSGMLQGDIEKQPAGKQMIITTEHSRAEVLGTVFTISSSDVSSLLDVGEGTVRFVHKNKAVLVPAKHYASAGGDAEFKVKENDRPLYKSPLVDKSTPGHQVPIKIKIEGARMLYLVISNGGLNNRFDHGAWIRPRLLGPAGEIDLTERTWEIAKSGAFSIERNKGYHGGPLIVKKKVYKKGIAAHATSIIAWEIPEGYDTFEALGVLLDTGAYRKNQIPIPSMHFEVYTSMPEQKLKKLLIRRHHY